MAYSAQVDLMWRYARRWASGIGADISYGTYADRVRDLDEAAGRSLPHSPWSFGLGLRHEAYYHRLSLDMALGVYLYRHMGASAKEIEKPYYERIGIFSACRLQREGPPHQGRPHRDRHLPSLPPLFK